MKTPPTILLLLGLSASMAFTQLQYEHTFNESASITLLEGTGEVYYSMDVNINACHIYRPDQSLMMSISLPMTSGYYLSDIQHVSRYMFNADEKVELVYTCSRYVPTENSYYYTFETKVINEDGQVELTLPGVGFTQVIETESGTKFLAYQYDYSVIPYQTKTLVYCLPEQSTTKSAALRTELSTRHWPNPADQVLNISLGRGGSDSGGELVISDMGGRDMIRLAIKPSSKTITVPVRDLPEGTYLYQIINGEGEGTAKKLIVRH